MRLFDDRFPPWTRVALHSATLLLSLTTTALPCLFAGDEPPAVVKNAAARETRGPARDEPAVAAPDGLSGTVRDEDGRPVADVAITATQARREIDFINGVLGDLAIIDGLYAKTGEDGRYQFAPQAKKIGLFAYHAKGYARRSADELAESSDLTLEPWGRVEGVVTIMGEPLANAPVRFMLDATDQHSMFYDVYEYKGMTDDQGRYSVEHVPAGVALASLESPKRTRVGEVPMPYGSIASDRRRIRPGQTLKLNIGGTGRSVVGQLRGVDGAPAAVGGGNLVLKPREKLGIPSKTGVGSEQPATPPEKPVTESDAVSPEVRREQIYLQHLDAYRSPQGLARRLAVRAYGIQINADGTFRAVEVVPGTYILSLWIGNDYNHPIVTREVIVKTGIEQQTNVPLDVGKIDIPSPAAK